MTQDMALTILKTGAHVFLTGEPGSGKSHTVNAYVTYLASQGIEASVTASTGIAATHIGGMTIHSWSGIGIKDTLTEYDLELLWQKEKVVRRVRDARVLIIDEISMLSSATLMAVDQVCRTLRGVNRPFGGLQMVFVGDFFQLPPVTKKNATVGDDLSIQYEEPQTSFVFTSSVWRQTNPLVCYLHEQHRQEDSSYLEVLSAIRQGSVGAQVRAILQARNVTPKKNVSLTKLFPHNAHVDRINEAELARLSGTSKVFTMQSRGSGVLVESLKRNCLSPERLVLKEGARVLFTKNSTEGDYVNGTVGEVVAFSGALNAPLVKLSTGRVLSVSPDTWSILDGTKKLAEITQLPLRLAWAITVHKSQGMSLDGALIDLSEAFEYGQGYVALSRVRSLSGLYLLGFNERALEVHPDVLSQDALFREASDATEDAFSSMSAEEIDLMHERFVKVCGAGVPSRAAVPESDW